MGYLTALGATPYQALCRLMTERVLGITDMMVPLKSSYTDSANNGVGAPEKSDGELSDSGISTRDNDDNANRKAKGWLNG